REGQRSQSQFQINQTAHLNRGSHSFQFGADYVRLAPLRHDAARAISVMTNSIDDLSVDNIWTANSPRQRTEAILKEVSFFAADTWRVSSRMTANVGLRWEISPAPLPDGAAYFLNPLKDTPSPAGGPSGNRPMQTWRLVSVSPFGLLRRGEL